MSNLQLQVRGEQPPIVWHRHQQQPQAALVVAEQSRTVEHVTETSSYWSVSAWTSWAYSFFQNSPAQSEQMEVTAYRTSCTGGGCLDKVSAAAAGLVAVGVGIAAIALGVTAAIPTVYIVIMGIAASVLLIPIARGMYHAVNGGTAEQIARQNHEYKRLNTELRGEVTRISTTGERLQQTARNYDTLLAAFAEMGEEYGMHFEAIRQLNNGIARYITGQLRQAFEDREAQIRNIRAERAELLGEREQIAADRERLMGVVEGFQGDIGAIRAIAEQMQAGQAALAGLAQWLHGAQEAPAHRAAIVAGNPAHQVLEDGRETLQQKVVGLLGALDEMPRLIELLRGVNLAEQHNQLMVIQRQIFESTQQLAQIVEQMGIVHRQGAAFFQSIQRDMQTSLQGIKDSERYIDQVFGRITNWFDETVRRRPTGTCRIEELNASE